MENSAGAANIIIQKYNDFCGFLPRKQASDLSPVNRQPCWHVMRDMPVLIDDTVPLCFQNVQALAGVFKTGGEGEGERVMGNIFNDSLESVWERGDQFYKQQCEKKYEGCCAVCDEYYTFNF
jgi:spiro-SPASM protein